MENSRDRLGVYEVFIGNLAHSVTEDDLRNLFSECGPIIRIYIAPEETFVASSKHTYGFVGFTDECCIKRAVNWFNGKSLHGRTIRVEETHRRKQSATTSPSGQAVSRVPAVQTASDNGVKERMLYVQKCYDNLLQVKPELKLPAWSDLEKRIHRQTFSLSQPFTFPAGDVSVDLEKIDELVKKTSSSSNTQTKT